jgi:hypothetical protein
MTVGSTGFGRELDDIDHCHGYSAKMSFKSGIRASVRRYIENQPMLYSYSVNPARPYWTMRVTMFKLAALRHLQAGERLGTPFRLVSPCNCLYLATFYRDRLGQTQLPLYPRELLQDSCGQHEADCFPEGVPISQDGDQI